MNKVTASLTTKRDKYYVVVSWNEGSKRRRKCINAHLSSIGNHKRILLISNYIIYLLMNARVELQKNKQGID